jgi:hypothetical protein
MFGCVRVNGAEVTETTRIRESSFASGGGGTQTMKGRGGAVSIIVEGIRTRRFCIEGEILSTQMRRKIE